MKLLLLKHLFAIVLGLIDGILTVLTLATGKVLDNDGEAFSFLLALRMALVTAVSGGCVYFISEYARQRHRLIHAEKELNMTQHGRFALTNLGKQVFYETLTGVIISASCSFLGAFIPISGAVFFPGTAWITIVLALIILGILGLSLAQLVYGKIVNWIISLIVVGVVVSFIGYELHVI